MMQIIEQTHDEKVAMYMKSCTKKQLAEMLTNCNEILSPYPNISDGTSTTTSTVMVSVDDMELIQKMGEEVFGRCVK